MKKVARKIFWWFIVLSETTAVFFVCLSAGGSPLFKALAANSEAEVPKILPRSTWDNSSSLNALMAWSPQNAEYPSDWQPVERIVIHHTATPNNDPVSAISRIQSIYRFHAVTQGWGDIGYNYLIDAKGNIYEGRYGGNGSRGAHVYYDKPQDNFNYGTIGIAVLGTYDEQDAPAAVYDSLYHLVGWLAAANGLDPLQLNRSTFVWNTATKSFSSKYTLPAVLGHKEIESTTCPGKINMNQVRQQAAQYAAKFKNYIYQANGSAKVYRLQGGSRQVFENLGAFAQQGGSYEKLANISLAQLDIFSESRFLKYPDGSLIKINGQPEIFIIDGGQRRHLNVTAKEFAKLGFDFAQAKEVTADEAANYPQGIAIKYGPDKSLLSDGQKVFYIEGGKKRWVTSGQLFNLLKYRWSQVKTAPDNLAQYLEGDFMRYSNGTLLRETGGEKIYLISDGQKKEFVSAKSFVANGYGWSKVISVEPAEAALYGFAGYVGYPDGTLLQAEGSQQVFVVEKGKLRAFLSAEIFINLGNKWSEILKVGVSELALYIQGEPARYREGTLLRAKNSPNVYLISGGKPAAIDAATFTKKKYKWSQVLVVSDADFANLYGEKAVTSVDIVFSSATATSGSVSTAAPPASQINQPNIRVAIFEVTSSGVIFTANSAYDVLDKNNQVIATKSAGQEYSFSYSNVSDAYVKITPQSADGAVEIKSYEDHPAWKPSLNYNKFRGSVEIKYSSKSGKLWAVNELPMEDYLRGVAETAEGEPTEYLKTMTVAARTYAYHYYLIGGKYGVDEVYHLTNKTGDQLYKGYGREVLAPQLQAAVSATRGEIVAYNGQPIVAAYSSGAAELKFSGSRSACTVWGGKYCQNGFEYLKGGVKDPDGSEYKYSSCSGANHCVGLSGAGTRQFGRTGAKNYQEILRYYYSGTEIKKAY